MFLFVLRNSTNSQNRLDLLLDQSHGKLDFFNNIRTIAVGKVLKVKPIDKKDMEHQSYFMNKKEQESKVTA